MVLLPGCCKCTPNLLPTCFQSASNVVQTIAPTFRNQFRLSWIGCRPFGIATFSGQHRRYELCLFRLNQNKHAAFCHQKRRNVRCRSEDFSLFLMLLVVFRHWWYLDIAGSVHNACKWGPSNSCRSCSVSYSICTTLRFPPIIADKCRPEDGRKSANTCFPRDSAKPIS